MHEKRKKVICDLVKDQCYVPMKEKELAMFMQVKPEDRGELKKILSELVAEGKLSVTERGKYVKGRSVPEKLVGTFIGNARGFGFVEIEGREQDLFIPEEGVNGAFNRDTVAVRLSGPKQGKRQEAEVTQIISRGTTSLVGIYQHAGNYGFVIPDNEKFASDIFVPKERSKGAVTGHKVVVELTDYGDLSKNPEGRVAEILGHVNDPGVDILSIVKGFELPLGFSEKVINQAKRVAKDVSDKDREGRKDLRNVTMVTIDGEDAKDLDDAVSLSKEGDQYLLGVHIADVTNYVQENSALDHEALERGTSVYLVDRVIPMLPHALSNGICSLNMGEDRLALSCLMTLDQKGTVISYEIAETVINVDRRMSYTDVNRVLTGDEEAVKAYEDLAPMFLLMKELADLVRERRRSRGSIDFDFPESKILLDEDGVPISIQ